MSGMGIRGGMRAGLVVSIGLAVLTLTVASRIQIPVSRDPAPIRISDVWKSFPPALRWLLASDILIRTCDAMVDVFLVIFAVSVIHVSAPRFGAVIAIQAMTAILVYIPAARIAQRTGKKPFVIGTFIAFAVFPLGVVWSTSFAWLAAAFVVGGLREVGEPARKALIIDLAEPALRARVVGLYYFGRSVAIAPAAFIGGLLWRLSPGIPFYVAAAVGIAGVVVFAATVSEQDAG